MFEAFANSPTQFLELLSAMLGASHTQKNRVIAVSLEVYKLLASPELNDYIERDPFFKVTLFSIGVLMGVDVFKDFNLPSNNFKVVWW